MSQQGPMALTQLMDDEQLFRDTVRRFATEQIGPLVRGMDESQQMDSGLIRKLFELGLMGIEVPEEYGGAGGTFFNAILAVEEISAVDPSVGVMVDVQNTLCINALVRWANEEQKKKISDAAGDRHHRIVRAERGFFGLGRVCSADASGQARRRLCAERPEALDHECEGGWAVYRLCDARSVGGIQGNYSVSGREGCAGLYAWQEGRQARHPGIEHLRADLQRLRRTGVAGAGRTGQRL